MRCANLVAFDPLLDFLQTDADRRLKFLSPSDTAHKRMFCDSHKYFQSFLAKSWTVSSLLDGLPAVGPPYA